MKFKILKLLIILFLLFGFSTYLLLGFYCGYPNCSMPCWCQGSIEYSYDECCGYCWNPAAGGWLDCCSDVCFYLPK